ncbi:Pumilio domain-containing protein C56F2.08c [Choanephora cucurbitarum]|uniref:Pumilio domain-containing protein C56F2.08c n=1 Tax=Choanephora cucurbitarum TaxID=101091 RepID=A0A1C7NCV5_9FUNG|nr:Pumilio domain-containing protein C56F2.08c [Choanephora cucurbitarum]
MKEVSPLRQMSGSVYSTSRDLEIVFEESDSHAGSYSTLNFLRPNKTSYSTLDIPSSPSPVRRPRAGTMPSFIQPPELHRPNNAALLLNTIEAGRHRSGSLNLPPPPPVDASFWSAPLSPSSEQLLQNDSDFSIARTMRSLGLEDQHQDKPSEQLSEENPSPPLGLFHHATPPEFLLPSRSLLSGNNRNRSYSVNATARYEPELPPMLRPTQASALEGFNRQQQNRPRASSMGRADAIRILPPPSSFWNNNRSSPLVSMTEEEYPTTTASLSLGDSELLANMLNSSNSSNSTKEELEGHTTELLSEKPYLHYSQSTPTTIRETTGNLNNNLMMQHQQQVASRSLWVGNIDQTITIDLLTQVFSAFGPIESVRLLVEKECGFVNFFQVEDAIRAKEEILGHMGGRIGHCIVRIGFGKADAAVTETTVLQPTRALWLGNIPGNTTPTCLQDVFSEYGTIESVRVLSHKNCGFINFETVESAIKAKDAVLTNQIDGFVGTRVGFAKIPPPQQNAAEQSDDPGRSEELTDATILWQNELVDIMKQFEMDESVAIRFVKDLKTCNNYYDSIPAVPELSANRKYDSARLREMRKRIDNASTDEEKQEEAELVALECLEDIAEISSEQTKTKMLERIAPHLAAISIHKNGTWATQKMIDLAKTPEQIHLIQQHLQPYVPPLLLDQFGNYAVQCFLRLGDLEKAQFVFDAMVEKLMNIAQGRFGARSMRGILESEYITVDQKKFVVASLCQNAMALSTNANSGLLLTWLIESTDIPGRIRAVASRLAPYLSQLCIHKVASQTIYKLVNQTTDLEAQQIILNELIEKEHVLNDILSDQVRGLIFVQKVITCPALLLPVRTTLSKRVCSELEKMNGPGHKKLLGMLLESNGSD